jgi:plasmid stabilization system protein ParE
MVKVIWTARSLKDLEEIAEYISKDSFRYAKLTLEKLIETAELIGDNQLLGIKLRTLSLWGTLVYLDTESL